MNDGGQKVRIHINRVAQESPNPTTGVALYALGQLGAHQELFREVEGDREDEPVAKDAAVLHLTQDEHFYSERDYKIIVNGRHKTVTKRELSFDDVVKLAFENPPTGPNVMFTVTYRNGPPKNPEGSLLEGQSVKIKDGMVFNVVPTDKS